MSDQPVWLARQEAPAFRIGDELSIRAALRLILGLTRQAQLEVYEQLGEYLAEVGEPESRHAATVRRQAEGLAAIERVAQAARLPPGKAPTRTQFAEFAPGLGITLSVSSIGRTFRTWRNAQATFERRVLPETARQVRQRQALNAQTGRTPVEHLALVNEWAATTDDISRDAYERWQKTSAADAAKGEPVPVTSRSLLRLFPGLTWDELVELSGTGVDLVDEGRKRVEKSLAEQANPLGLVNVAQAAALLMRPVTFVRDRLIQRKSGFPVVVAVIGGERVLVADDVRAYARTGKAPPRTRGELQNDVYDATALAAKLGVRRSQVDTPSRRHRIGVPPPDGQVGQTMYWLRATVDAATGPDPSR